MYEKKQILYSCATVQAGTIAAPPARRWGPGHKGRAEQAMRTAGPYAAERLLRTPWQVAVEPAGRFLVPINPARLATDLREARRKRRNRPKRRHMRSDQNTVRRKEEKEAMAMMAIRPARPVRHWRRSGDRTGEPCADRAFDGKRSKKKVQHVPRNDRDKAGQKRACGTVTDRRRPSSPAPGLLRPARAHGASPAAGIGPRLRESAPADQPCHSDAQGGVRNDDRRPKSWWVWRQHDYDCPPLHCHLR